MPVQHFVDPATPERTLCGRAAPPPARGVVGYVPPCRVCERVTRESAREDRIAASTPG